MFNNEDTIWHSAIKPLLHHEQAAYGVDDCAYFNDNTYAITSDVMVENIHFLPHDKADHVAHKLLYSNISDIIASGARPTMIQIQYSFYDSDTDFAEHFFGTLHNLCHHHNIIILGGDTVRAPSNNRFVGLTMIGDVTDKPWLRKNAIIGDYVLVTNTIGDAAIGLEIAKGRALDDAAINSFLLHAYHCPTPPINFAYALQHTNYVHGCMDISDGLYQDMHKICDATQCGVQLYERAIPLSSQAQHYITYYNDNARDYYSAGDDYQLLFTASPHHIDHIYNLATAHNSLVSVIGHIQESQRELKQHDNTVISLPKTGFCH